METNPQIALAERYVETTHVSLFLTGKAGTGKTTFLRHLVEHTSKRHIVVAPTGVAAVNAGGVTIHSFFQLPFCPYLPDVKELVTEYQMPQHQRQLRKEKMRIIRTLDLLIIDEISMVRADLLDAIDDTLRRFRRNSRPFGGVQLLMIGDVQQLPPVVTDEERPYMERVYPSPFFFHSKALQRMNYITIELQTIYRQQDQAFVHLLNNIRDNRFDEETLRQLNSRYSPKAGQDPEQQAIRLTTHNRQADSINQRRMEALTTQAHTFDAVVEGNFPEGAAPCDTHLTLKEGAQVMFVKNDSSGARRYINGTLGRVEEIAFDKEDRPQILVKKEDGKLVQVGHERWENIRYEIDSTDNQIKQKVDGTFAQYPLRLAWAITIHKAQGLTFDRVVVDAGQAFAYGQVYVALSRCRTLEGLQLSSPITPAALHDNSDVHSFVGSYTPEEQAQAMLSAQQVGYHYEMLFELFDFSVAERAMERLALLFQDRIQTLYPQQTSQLLQLRNGQMVEMVSVAERFRRQLMGISQMPPDDSQPIPNRPLLDERVGKAINYFFQKINELIAALQPLLTLEIDNRETRNNLKEYSDALLDALMLRRYCMQQVREGFSVEGYLKAKHDYILDNDGTKKKKSEPERGGPTVYTGKENPGIIPMLSQWRKSVSADRGLLPYLVLRQKTLLAIADVLPQTERELLAIPGIGEAKMRMYGTDILDIVQQYLHDRSL